MGEAHAAVNERTMVRLTLLCHAATSATRRAAFPLDESLEAKARDEAAALARDLPTFDRVLAAPSRRTRETAAGLGLSPTVVMDDDLRDLDAGRWAGRTLAEIAAREPDAIAAWQSDADAAPHGGESVVSLIARVGRFLDAQRPFEGRVLAITHPAVVRAALVAALVAPPAAFWQVDVAPLAGLALHGHAGGWRLRGLGRGSW